MNMLDGYHLHKVYGLKARLMFGLVCMMWRYKRGG